MRLVQFNPNNVYQLDELIFYIPKSRFNITPFLLIKDAEGNKDVLKLKQSGADRIYNIYSVSLDNNIVLKHGKAILSVLLIEEQILHSRSCEIYLDYENFTAAQQIKLIQDISDDIAKKYRQIFEMTQMNIDIYQSIEEGVFK